MSFQLKKIPLLTYTNNLLTGPLIAVGLNVTIIFHHYFIKPLSVLPPLLMIFLWWWFSGKKSQEMWRWALAEAPSDLKLLVPSVHHGSLICTINMSDWLCSSSSAFVLLTLTAPNMAPALCKTTKSLGGVAQCWSETDRSRLGGPD